MSDVSSFNYQNTSDFARRYLATYYGAVDPDEAVVLEFLARKFFATIPATRMIDVGCGPTIHHLISASRVVSRIDVVDLLSSNCAEIIKFRDGATDAHDWTPFFRFVLQREGMAATPNEVATRLRLLQGRLGMVGECNLLQPDSLTVLGQYPLVSSFYCAEAIGTDKSVWEDAMSNLSSLVEPRGRLLLSALRRSNFYSLLNLDGSETHIPITFLDEGDLRSIFQRLGFDPNNTQIESRSVVGQEDEGINGVLLVDAWKL